MPSCMMRLIPLVTVLIFSLLPLVSPLQVIEEHLSRQANRNYLVFDEAKLNWIPYAPHSISARASVACPAAPLASCTDPFDIRLRARLRARSVRNVYMSSMHNRSACCWFLSAH